MSHIKSHVVTLTTDGSGDGTAYSGFVNGKIVAVLYAPGTMATGADLTITGNTSGQAILTVTNAGTSAVRWAPRMPTHDTSAGAALYAAGGAAVNDQIGICDEMIKIVVAQGGASKTGTITFLVE